MSDSDDTDVLLLVPPDLFVINSPACISPVHPECTNDILTGHAETVVSVMENEYRNFSPFKYRSYQSVFPVNRNNEFSPIVCSDLSVEKTDNNRIDDFFQNNFDKHKTRTPDMGISDGNKYEKLTNRTNENCANAENESGQSPKFSLRQVDKLLNEMEKTRAEIKSKLQTNKNKIHEMRREYTFNNNTDQSFTNNDKNIIISSTKNEISTSFKRENITKPLNTDVDILLPGEPKNLLRLTKIMSSDNDFETMRQKLEAETIKKKHCEDLIQQLQSSLLEQQQNMNVALRVDAQKDEVIGQLRQSWTQLVEHWKELEQQRQDLVRMIEQERLEAVNAQTSYHQKSEQLENRLLDAVSLANGYREKNEKLEKTLSETQSSLRKNEECVKLLEMEKVELVQQLEQTIKSLSDEKEKTLSLESRISNFQIQISSLSCEKNELVEKYEEEKNLTSRLKSEIVKLKLNYTRASGAELAALKEANSLKQEMTKIKNSLKEFYQKQLDTVLKEKVDEFQKEIDKAQAMMHVELHKQEKLAEDRLQMEIGRLKEAHKLELSEERRINQKHVNILKGELKESRKKILDLENRVKLDSRAKEKLSELIQAALHTQRLDMLNNVSDILEGSSKELLLKGRDKFMEDFRIRNNDEDLISDFEFSSDQNLPTDLRKYVEMLLERAPGNPVEKEMALRALFSDKDLIDKKSHNQRQNGSCRRRPPWK